jgi:uncharacterized protein YhaN
LPVFVLRLAFDVNEKKRFLAAKPRFGDQIGLQLLAGDDVGEELLVEKTTESASKYSNTGGKNKARNSVKKVVSNSLAIWSWPVMR